MPSLAEAVRATKAGLLAKNSETMLEVVQLYREAYQGLSYELDQMTRKIIAAKSRGLPISEDWIYRNLRLQSLLEQVENRFDHFAVGVDPLVAEGQQWAISEAASNSVELLRAAMGAIPEDIQLPREFTTFNPLNVETLAGRLSNGSPLRSLLQEIAPNAVEAFRKDWVKGMVIGESPREVSKRIVAQVEGLSKDRALTITRTEVIGSYRTTSLESYRDRSKVIRKWRWTCSKSARTCGMCLAMDGRLFDLDAELDSHPNCRCTPVPVPLSWEELGFKGIPDRRPKLETGDSWLRRQTEETQVKVLGRKRASMYRNGELTLDEVVGYREDPDWGPTRWTRSLVQIENERFKPPKASMGSWD